MSGPICIEYIKKKRESGSREKETDEDHQGYILNILMCVEIVLQWVIFIEGLGVCLKYSNICNMCNWLKDKAAKLADPQHRIENPIYLEKATIL